MHKQRNWKSIVSGADYFLIEWDEAEVDKLLLKCENFCHTKYLNVPVCFNKPILL